MERYNEILKAIIGIPELSVNVSNPFPVKGDTVTLETSGKWLREHNYAINDGSGESNEVIPAVLGKSRKDIIFNNAGEIMQTISGTNASGEVEVRKNIYVSEAALEPYFSIYVDKEIIRNDGERTTIILTADNGYDFTRERFVRIDIYRENEETNPALTITELTLADGKLQTGGISFTDRGIYDVEVTFSDTVSGTTFVKRINKLITVTPALAPRADAVELVISSKTKDIDLSAYAPGTTVVLMDDPNEPEGYMRRLRMVNANGTKEQPVIITIDRDTPIVIAGNLYQGIWVGNSHHIVIDGRGYRNIKRGIKTYRYPGEKMTMGIQVGNGTSVMEIFEVEIGEVNFAGISAKTDPNANQPEYWFGNFEMNLSVHHCYIHDTDGEGMYLGYYGSGLMTGTNTSGEKVTYRAHSMQNTRVYRNLLENIGYDSIQLNNARESEICYNIIHGSGIRGEADQATGFSLSIQGKVYNNIIKYYLGPGIQFSPLGRIEFFNNIISNGPDGAGGLLILSNRDIPEMNTSGTDINTDIPILIHNNILMSRSICINARDVIQFMNVHIVDNLLTYKDSLTGGQQEQAKAAWESNMKGNRIMQFKEVDYNMIDALKIADSANGDFRIAYDSPLVSSGNGKYFSLDFNGYKSWYPSTFPTGPFLGIYKNPDIVSEPLSFDAFMVNGGESTTVVPVVKLAFEYRGIANRYRVGESEDLSGIDWKELAEVNTFVLSDGFGVKTIYAQLGGVIEESAVLSAVLEYIDLPVGIASVKINAGAAFTYNRNVTVVLECVGNEPPVSYRIGETSDLSACEWKDYSNSFPYILSDNYANKTVYVQVKTSNDNVSEIKSVTIEYKETPKLKVVISTGWIASDLDGGKSFFDSEYNLTKVAITVAGNTGTVYSSLGEAVGTFTKIDSKGASYMLETTKGASTGNNSGIYPDSVMEHNICVGGNGSTENYREDKIVIPSGTYKIRLFCSTITGSVAASRSAWKLSVGGVVTEFVLPEGFTPANNLNDWLEQTIDVGEEGFSIIWGVKSSGAYIQVPLNIIEIEEI